MGLFEKIKNALFEEEYVEVEEKPKKPKKDVLEKDFERPIAKKVVLPRKEEPKIEELDESEYMDEDFEIQPKKEEFRHSASEVKDDFKILNENDFKVDDDRDVRHSEPKIVKVFDNDDAHYFQSKNEKHPYGINESSRINISDYGKNNDGAQYSGLYERKEDKTHFKPSPIISPIYGILDKNYKKEDVITKKEIRLTSSYAKENLSVDDVRKKAYGSLSDDIVNGLTESENKDTTFSVENKVEPENLLVDLSNDEEKPAVKEVTMGDALEYFEDLGLEYNVDYVDATKEKTIGRRSDNYVEPQITHEIPIITKEIKEEQNTEINKEETFDSDDNLFDLIDSMYKEND